MQARPNLPLLNKARPASSPRQPAAPGKGSLLRGLVGGCPAGRGVVRQHGSSRIGNDYRALAEPFILDRLSAAHGRGSLTGSTFRASLDWATYIAFSPLLSWYTAEALNALGRPALSAIIDWLIRLSSEAVMATLHTAELHCSEATLPSPNSDELTASRSALSMSAAAKRDRFGEEI